MPTKKSIAALDCIWLPYTQMATAPPPHIAVATHGVRIVLDNGRELIDGTSSWWTACHGYNHPHIHAAVSHQLDVMPHVMFGGLVHEPALRLASRLSALLPGDLERVFFTESGSVAVEVALKMARQYWINGGQPKRQRIIHFRHSYHGDTFATMAVCDPEEGMHTRFSTVMPQEIMAELPTDETSHAAFEQCLALHAHEVAAVIIEPLVQGAGGMKMHDAPTLTRVAASCTRHNVLLIADEIMTGFGRTGRMFACEEAEITPDIMCLSKALTGGTVALAATVARRHLFEAFLSNDPAAALMHGPTFMANPLACAAAHASLDLFAQEPRLAQVAAIELQLKDELAPCRQFAHVHDVRVKGAIGVVEMRGAINLTAYRTRFAELGVWVRPFGNVVYLMPPFIISPQDLRTLTSAIVQVMSEYADKN
ncbi:MAG: adenosylmethionine--8-amino-7-oxononanoate transaminase [Rugosibacter sp.]|jgi:adenosylmethionine-8-amino-7-oxononanoate aminotransferase|nr:adenosylmethionine--8-amino-7-oxononanoate transaminase [Rugosibacter sp.]MDO9273589.1 adenosylmethionine--8-amino-7-oxononanoate transaminase [Rugosibacter sp.]